MTVTYQCSSCKRETTVKNEKHIPTCCGKPMNKMPLEICLQPDHAEHARPMESQDACDDFRSG